MNKQIEIIKKTRIYLLEQIKDLSTEQLNKIPEGFNNNIIWNLGHMVATQQGICYRRAGLPIYIEENIWESYHSGTSPGAFVDAAAIDNIKYLMATTIDQLEIDLDKGISNYTPWTTRYDVELKSLEDAVNFLPYHEGLHCGCIMALKRLVIQ